jgi:hypothetical protein
MNTKELALIIESLNKKVDFPTKEVASLIDAKVENDIEKVLHILKEMDKTITAKQNVLLGMISFLGIVLTAVSIIVGLK